jgi:ubiquinone/menaquinone biosynthesis C-methylase UbiE/peptidoglycan/xylan/chitin deacetylase (PgdA/CDA1 family)
MWNGLLSNPQQPLIRDILPRIVKAHSANRVYVEKQVSLVPFMQYLHSLTDCKFLVMTRNGQDAVRSMMEWHCNMFPLFYQEIEERSGEVAETDSSDSFNRSLPRPGMREEYSDRWFLLDRISMVSYYWNRIAVELSRQIETLPADCLMRVDLAELSVEKLAEVYEFVGLSDFDEEKIGEKLSRKINSVSDRTGESKRVTFEWDDNLERKFGDFASHGMRELGYWGEQDPKQKPEGFGKFWIEEKTDLAWFKEIYEYRRPLHELFKQWMKEIEKTEDIQSVIDLGFGIGHGYLDFLAEKEFVGVDLNPNNIEHCEKNCAREGHRFLCQDTVESPINETFDLVFSHSTIDNVHDPEVFLRNACRMTGKLLYLSSYRGWFPKFREHQVTWDDENRVYFNDVSPSEVARILEEEGFSNYAIFPQKSFRDDIKAETIIIASRVPISSRILTAYHERAETFLPYETRNDDVTSARDILESVNQSCHYFSTSEGGYLADNLVDFDQLIEGVSAIESRHVGMMRDFCSGDSKANLGIRIDVDMDLMAGVDMANLAGLRNVPLSFYLLHTAPYYGRLEDKVFLRNERSAKVYRTMQDQGHEIGLHTDALTIYRDWGIDGAQAVKCEIEWLRSQGIEISGTAAHNCAPVYGAENFEVFSEHVIGERDHTVSRWSHLPLGTLSEKELGLAYEANQPNPADHVGSDQEREYLSGLPFPDFNRNARWMRTYLLNNPHNTWGSDYRIWHLGGKFWVIAGMDDSGNHDFRFGVSQGDVIEFLAGLDAKRRAVIVLHPAYFGQRLGWGQDPLLSAARQRNKFLKALYSLKYRIIRKVENRVNEMAEKERKKMNES